MKLLRTFIIAVAALAYSTASAQLTSGLTHDEKKEALLCPYFDIALYAGPWIGNRSFKQSNTSDKLFNGTNIGINFNFGLNISKKKSIPLFAEFAISTSVGWDSDINLLNNKYKVYTSDINVGGDIAYIIPIVKSKVEIEPYAGLGFSLFTSDFKPFTEGGNSVNFFSKEDKAYSDTYVRAYDSEHKAKRAGVYGSVGAKIILFNKINIGYQYRPHLTKFFSSDYENIRLTSHLITIGYRF